MTLEELAEQLETVRGEIRVLRKYCDDLMSKIRVVCDHPETYRGTFTWEHDNGYGRQSICTGVRCTLCFSKKHYTTWT